jgi:hypothetical protein
MWSITDHSDSPGKFYRHHARLVQMLIEALLLKMQILQLDKSKTLKMETWLIRSRESALRDCLSKGLFGILFGLFFLLLSKSWLAPAQSSRKSPSSQYIG